MIDGVFTNYSSEDPTPPSAQGYLWGDDLIDGGGDSDELFGDSRSINYAITSGTVDQTVDLGDDTLFGGSGDDWVYGDGNLTSSRYSSSSSGSGPASVMTINGGDDVLSGGSGNDYLLGEGYNLVMVHWGTFRSGSEGTAALIGGDDLLDGGDGVDTLIGDGLNVFFRYGITGSTQEFIGGNDTLLGGEGADNLIGDALLVVDDEHPSQTPDGTRYLTGGDDVLNGGDSDDTIVGDFQSYALSDGYNVVTGGNDTISGGEGDDRLCGDIRNFIETPAEYTGGADVFVFLPDSGQDTIYDFEVGVDRIDVSGLGITSMNDLSGMITYDQNTGSAVIDWDGPLESNDELILLNVSQLTEDDFIFA